MAKQLCYLEPVFISGLGLPIFRSAEPKTKKRFMRPYLAATLLELAKEFGIAFSSKGQNAQRSILISVKDKLSAAALCFAVERTLTDASTKSEQGLDANLFLNISDARPVCSN